jgi:hypothetical protein
MWRTVHANAWPRAPGTGPDELGNAPGRDAA